MRNIRFNGFIDEYSFKNILSEVDLTESQYKEFEKMSTKEKIRFLKSESRIVYFEHEYIDPNDFINEESLENMTISKLEKTATFTEDEVAILKMLLKDKDIPKNIKVKLENLE